MSDPKMDTNVTASTVKPTGSAIPNGTPGKAQGYGVANAPFEAIGNDSGETDAVYFPPDQSYGQRPGMGRTTNNPDS